MDKRIRPIVNRINHLINNNIIFITSIFTLLIIITLFGSYRYNAFDNYSCISYKIGDNTDEIYNTKSHYVKATLNNLYYSGYNYLLNGQVKGHYYYILENGHCYIVLLSNKTHNNAALINDTPIDEVTINARLMKDDANYTPLLTYMSERLDWNYTGLSKITDPYIISEPDYSIKTSYLFKIILLLFAIIEFVLIKKLITLKFKHTKI